MHEVPIAALLYDGHHSRASPVTLTLSRASGAPRLAIEGTDPPQDFALANVTIDERVGDAPRFLHLPQGASVEVLDNVAFDAALEESGLSTAEQAVRRLEGRWHYAIVAVIGLVAVTWAFLTFGVPALASRAVALIPPSWDARLGAEGLELLDRGIFAVSALPQARQDELRRAFADVASRATGGRGFRLEFRGGGVIGANALALPSGIVVLTDELERASRHDDELRAVFAHEVGHLAHRHAMRRLVQSSATALLVLGLFGDASGVSSLVVAVPTVLTEAAYSRDLEREADEFAYRWMAQRGVRPDRLTDLLARLMDEDEDVGAEYLSSHPRLAERVRNATQFRRTPAYH